MNTIVIGPLDRFLNSQEYKSLSPTIDTSPREQQTAYFKETHKLLNFYKDRMRSLGILVLNLSYDAANFRFSEDISLFSGKDHQKAERILDVLTAIGLMRRQTVCTPMPADFIGEFSATIDTCQLTTLGRRLLRACAKHQPDI